MRLSTGIRRILIPLALLTMLGVALAPLSTGTRHPASTDAGDFRAFMEPRLAILLESARTVEEMVQERSRNILALRAESQRIESIVAEIDAYLESREIPEWGDPVVHHFRTGSDLVLQAIEAAYDALSSFDFSAMPSMIPVFSEGTTEIDAALRTLRDHEGEGSSYTDAWVT